MPEKIVTLQRHIVEQQSLHPEASGAFTRMLWDLLLSTKLINREINIAGLAGILGAAGKENSTGDKVMRLDLIAQEHIYHGMKHGGHLCAMASEEVDGLIGIPEEYPKGNYVLLYDPLDGSSNIDVNVSVGTIFSLYRRVSEGPDGTLEDCLRAGTEQVAAGYVVYGSSTMLVYSTGKGVHGFTLDPTMGEFILSHPDMQIPVRGSVYSINEGNTAYFDEGTRRYLEYVKTPDPQTGRPYSARYTGSLVADFHRSLLYGGIYLYPAAPKPKLRLAYEAHPLAYLVEHAGGKASTGDRRIAEIVPRDLHEKVPLIVGSREDVEIYEAFYTGRR